MGVRDGVRGGAKDGFSFETRDGMRAPEEAGKGAGVPLRGGCVILWTAVGGVAPGTGPGARGIVWVAGHGGV